MKPYQTQKICSKTDYKNMHEKTYSLETDISAAGNNYWCSNTTPTNIMLPLQKKLVFSTLPKEAKIKNVYHCADFCGKHIGIIHGS